MNIILRLLLITSLFLVGCQKEKVVFVSDERGEPLKQLNGETFRFSDHKGKWIILNYWASWCEPCRNEIPELIKFQQAHEGQNVMVVGVNYDFVDPEQIRHYVGQFGITYPTLMNDPAMQLGSTMVEVLPTTFIISPDGKVIAQKVGEQTAAQLDKLINQTK